MKLFFFFFTLVLVKFKDYGHMISGLLASSKHEEGIWQKKARDIISHGELTSRLSRFFSLEGFLGWGAWKRPSTLSCFQNRVSELWETHDKNRLEQPQTEIISTWGLPQKLRTAKKKGGFWATSESAGQSSFLRPLVWRDLFILWSPWMIPNNHNLS